MMINDLIKFCDEKSKNIKLKAEPQVFVEIRQALEELKELRKGIKEIPIATIKISKEDMQKMVDEKVAQIELDIQEIRAKAVDEFVATLVPRLTDAIYQKDVESMTNLINGVAEELKAGVDDED